FVPPIYDYLAPDSFFPSGEAALDRLNTQIQTLEQDLDYREIQQQYQQLLQQQEHELTTMKTQMKEAKALRKDQRRTGQSQLSPAEFQVLSQQLDQESLALKNDYRRLKKNWQQRQEEVLSQLKVWQDQITALKTSRQNQSADLQQRLFDQYNFLNQAGQTKNVRELFQQTILGVPPAAAGDCAAPKLLQYAFQQQLRPICLAEFWWGSPSPTQVRKHAHYYPACRGKCEPILGHMLSGLPLDPNPLATNPGAEKQLEILYEDEHLLALNKPAGLLSVPGKSILDSVYERMRLRYPKATGPLIVHRLDMSTSGVLLIAKTSEAHRLLQGQFIRRRVQKRYVALLDGILPINEGQITLPLRVDLDHRPQQMVCYTHGKKAITHWKLISQTQGQSRVHFYPITGRTHQLRVHAAHQDGLNASIRGDELYGTRSDRLYLHAEELRFRHPITAETITISAPAPF
ncbi:MAG: pseudouridine synthase, partial [Bacteroidota bacterium]